MAKNEQAAKTPEKKNLFQKIGGFFKGIGVNVYRAFKNMIAELKKVSWPTRRELINVSLVVLAFMALMGVVIGLLDAGAGALMSAIIG